MKLLKPAWVNHEGHPIFSIDIHPDGSRFATGGQGADCGRVCIWNMSPVTNRSDEHKENVPKLLCRLDNHLSCVNCVRWSNGGRHLASAGDDKVIMIWQFCGQGGGSSFGGVVNAEQWRCAHTLRGHSGDILDLNWSPGDQFLATCSVDNTVRIWNAEQFPECLQVITGHSAFVKGVCWDPMNKYLATQSDDKSLRVWRTSDWKEETCVTKPFADCGGTTHVLRLGWCPDGQFLVSAHAMNNLGSTAQIIDRGTWSTEKDFVGHRKAITCVRFSPKMLYKLRKEKKSKFFCMAVGSRDRSLSVWLTNLRRPLVVMHELFNDSVLDVSWTHDGCRFLVCSWDGTVAYFEFTQEEIGQPLESDEMSAYLHRLYGKNMMTNNQQNSNHRAHAELDLFVEDVKLLEARKAVQESLKTSIQNGQTLSNLSKPSNTQDSSSSRLMKGPTDKQIEMRLSDGRRRITPLYIPPITNGDGMPVPFSLTEQTTFGSSKENASKIVIEKVDSPCQTFQGNDFSSKTGEDHSRKRSQEVSPSLINGSSPTHNASLSSKATENQEDPCELVKKAQKSAFKHTAPAQITTNAGTMTNKVQTIEKSKIKRKSDINPPPPPPPPTPKMGREDPSPSSSAQPSASNNGAKSAAEKRAERSGRLEGKIVLNLYPMRIDKTHSQLLVLSDKDTGSLPETSFLDHHPCVVVENDLTSNLSSVKLIDDRNTHWQVWLTSRVCGVCNSNRFVCVFCEDCTVHVFRLQSGARLLCPLIISAMPSRVRCIDQRLMLITTKGQLWMWDLNLPKILLRNVGLTSLYAHSTDSTVDLVKMSMSESGLPTVSLSTGRSYVYNSDMETWQLVADTHDLLHHSCDLSGPRTASGSECSLSQLQRYTGAVSSTFTRNKRLQSEATLTYIDQQLTAARLLQSAVDFRYWLNALGQCVIEHSLERRFRELCEYLLGPPLRSSTSDWQSTELGVDKRTLLNELLNRSTTNLKLQRVCLEFKEQLELVSLVNGG